MISSDLPNSLRERQEIINITLQVDKVKSRKGSQLSQGHTTLKWKDRLKRIKQIPNTWPPASQGSASLTAQ